MLLRVDVREPDDAAEPFVLAAVFFAVVVVAFFFGVDCWAALRVARARGVGRAGPAWSSAAVTPTKDS